MFVTISGEASGPLRKMSTRERYTTIREVFGDFSAGFKEADFEDVNFKDAASNILLSIMRFSFKSRYPVEYLPLLKLRYKDTTWMVTIGGYVADKKTASNFLRRVRTTFRFLPKWDNSEFFDIPQFNLTDAERRLFDFTVTKTPRNRSKVNLVRGLGFSTGYLRQYRDMIRYIPRFFESAI